MIQDSPGMSRDVQGSVMDVYLVQLISHDGSHPTSPAWLSWSSWVSYGGLRGFYGQILSGWLEVVCEDVLICFVISQN